MKKVFNQEGDFEAMRAAEKWCRDNGISVGEMQRDSPRGLKRGDFHIGKWRTLSVTDKKELDGQMTGAQRHGPVTVEITD